MRLGSERGSTLRGALVGLWLGVVGQALGCGVLAGGDNPPPGGPMDPTARDTAAYDQLTAMLAQNSTQFLSKQYSYQEADGDKLYYLDFPTYDPRLHRFDAVAQTKLDYAFSIGPGDAFNYRVSEALVVTAHSSGDQVEYDAYAADAPGQLVGMTTMMAPSSAKWWAYAPSGQDVYIVTYDSAGPTTTLNKWTPQLGGSPTPLFTLEAATGQANLGEFVDFGVDGDTIVFLVGGLVYQGSLQQQKASWLGNMMQVEGGDVHFDPDGVAFTTDSGWYFFQSASKKLVDLAMKVDQNAYRLNDTYQTAHYYDPDSNGFGRWKDYMLYIGGTGVFAYDLDHDTVTPVLLEPRDAPVRTVYRYPQATGNGLLFVTGLQSESGSVGADGPIFEVDLTKVLK